MPASSLAMIAIEMSEISRALAKHDDTAALELLERLGDRAGEQLPCVFAVEAFAALRQ